MSLEVNENDQNLNTNEIRRPTQLFKRTIAGLLTTVALYSGSILGATKAEATEMDNYTSISQSKDYENPNTIIDIPKCYRFQVAGVCNKETTEPITISDLQNMSDGYFNLTIKENAGSLDFLKYCKKIKHLSLYGMINDTSILKTMPDMPNVKSLSLTTDINNSEIGINTFDSLTVNSNDFAFIKSMSNLEELTIEGYSIEPEFIEELTTLKRLTLKTDGNYDLDFSKLIFLDKLSFGYEQIYTIAKDFTLEEYQTLVNNGVKIDLYKEEVDAFFKINKKLDNIINSLGLTETSTDQEKLDAILIYTLDNLKYDEHVFEIISNDGETDGLTIPFYDQGLLYGALEKDSAICGNYAALVEALACRVGLSSYYVKSHNHAWNLVEVEGNLYYVDPTWLDGNSSYTITTKEEIIDGKRHITTIHTPTLSQEFIRNNDTDALDWYMENPMNYIESNQIESHSAHNIPTYINLVPLESEFEKKNIESTISQFTSEEVIEQEPEIIDNKRFQISIGDKTWVIGGAVAVGIMSAVGGAITINKKQKNRKHHRSQRKDQLYSNPYNSMFDDLDNFYDLTYTNNR